MTVRVRFAPSPSGYLHIGGARTALFNWLWARKTGGTFIFRVEDTDQERSSLDSVRAQMEAMKWLGLDWDEGPEVGGPKGPYFQSERKHLYREYAERLIEEGKAYRCDMTKEELDRVRADFERENPKKKFVYKGPLRDHPVPPDRPHVVRFKSPRTGSTDFNDKVFGRISTPNAEQPDFVIMRSDGMPLYNFAAVIDDHLMDVTLVARGRDHVGNTPPQILLYQALGWQLPEFAHLPMMLSPSGEKLSKRHAAVSVQDYRDKGYTPMGVLNYLVRFGWSYGDQEIFSRRELIEVFDWERCRKSDGKFDDRKFADVAFEHLKREELTSSDDYATEVGPYLEQRIGRALREDDRERMGAAITTIRERGHTLVEAAYLLDFYFRDPPELEEEPRAKFLTGEAAAPLQALRSLLAEQKDFDRTALEASVKSLLERTGLTMKSLAQPARVALTGRKTSPGLFEVMEVLGKDRTLARLDRAIAIATSA